MDPCNNNTQKHLLSGTNQAFGDAGAWRQQRTAPNWAVFKWISLTRQSTGAGPPKNRGRVGCRVNLINSATSLPQTGQANRLSPLTPLAGPWMNPIVVRHNALLVASVVGGLCTSVAVIASALRKRLPFSQRPPCDAEIPSLRTQTGLLVKTAKKLFTLSGVSVNVLSQR